MDFYTIKLLLIGRFIQAKNFQKQQPNKNKFRGLKNLQQRVLQSENEYKFKVRGLNSIPGLSGAGQMTILTEP